MQKRTTSNLKIVFRKRMSSFLRKNKLISMEEKCVFCDKYVKKL